MAEHRLRRTPAAARTALSLASALAAVGPLHLAPAQAAPPMVVVDLVGDLDVTAQAGLRTGLTGGDAHADADAIAAVERAEQAFLDVNLSAAEADLVRALGHFFDRPLTVQPMVAYGAAIRLAQVLVASKRGEAAERLLERALEAWPGFPGEAAVPPDLTRTLRASRKRLATRLVGRLRIESEPTGLPARVGGRALGPTPISAEKLPLGTADACVDGPLGERCRRVDVGKESRTIRLVADAPSARADLARGLRERDAKVGGKALSALSAAVDQAPWCLVVAAPDTVTIARIEGRAPVAGAAASRPALPTEWNAVGAACVAPGGLDLSADAVNTRLWAGEVPAAIEPAGTPSAGRDPRWWLGWGGVGLGVAAAGVGVGLGLSATDAADRFNRTGRAADEDRARSQAVGADIAYVAGAALLGTGIYLLLSSD